MSVWADRLRAAGLTVVDHGHPGNGKRFEPRGVLLHHTGGVDSLAWMLSDAGFKGPKAHALVTREGVVHWLTDGGANHAGLGAGIPGMCPPDQGNRYLWGIEVESMGRGQDWPPAQWDAAHTVARVLAAGDPTVVWRHKDYTVRKPDTLYDLAAHRAAVAVPISPAVPPVVEPAPTPPGMEEDMKALIVKDGTGGTWVVAADLSSKCPLGDPNWTRPRLEATGLYVSCELDGHTFNAIPDVRF